MTLATALAGLAVIVGACAPGATVAPSSAPSSPSGTASAGPSATAVAALPTCGTDPVQLTVLFETGFDLPNKLSEEFTKQFPNVTFSISTDQFANLMSSSARILSGSNPPDLIRLPSLVTLAKDKLLKDLDPYATAFGWDKWPQSQFTQNRVGADGTRGAGTLYGFGLNFSMTGVFYNKKLAAQIRMTQPPATVADFEDLLAKAKAAGLVPIMQWNDSASGGGLAFPLQDLMAAFGPVQPINDWIFQKPNSTIDTPTNLTAAQHLAQWITSGYFPKDVNAIEYTAAAGRFAKDEGVFTFNGDWQNGAYTKDMASNVGFFAFPPGTAGGPLGAMSAPLTYGIAASAKHADCAAFFLNWVSTNPTARQINVTNQGSNPGGPSDLAMPTVDAASVTTQTLQVGAEVGKSNGAMDFIANSTGSIFAQGWTPELQKLVGGKQTADGLLKAVQVEYLKELAQQ
ncbi:MAG: carbohydrate ABC transporter substrate-binding protein [Chloroflexi bacterium]|nr:carbohydrate ABC transporter substrate-binding protein [Chloroflexota bacterium]